MKKIENELSNYLDEWVASRYSKWKELYHLINHGRQDGIYQLKYGSRLLDFLYSVISNLEEHFSHSEGTQLIPSCFSSEQQIMRFLDNYNNYVKDHLPLIEDNLGDEFRSYIVSNLYNIAIDIIDMVERCRMLYSCKAETEMPPAYVQMRNQLYERKTDDFIDIMMSIISSVPYNVHKEKIDEGYFHTIFHVICSTLGFKVYSEHETADGRIDAAIEFPHIIYILEFKYSENDRDESLTALNQIKEKHYDLPYHIKAVEIVGIGVSYGRNKRNINGYMKDTLYTPPLCPIGRRAEPSYTNSSMPNTEIYQ